MSLKARLRGALVALVTAVVVVMSLLYLSDFTKASFSAASDRADSVADQFRIYLENHLELETAAHGIHPASARQWEDTWTEIVRRDPGIAEMLKATLAKADLALAILITDDHGNVLAAAPPAPSGSNAFAGAQDIHQIEQRWWAVNLWDLITRRENYASTRPVGLTGSKHVLFNITVIIRSVLLKHSVEPALKNLLLAFALALGVSIFLGVVLPSLILDPLQRVSQSIDLIRTGQFGAAPQPERRESREFADVHSKLSLLDEQYRGAKHDANELRTNIEHLLQRLEVGVLLFDDAGRLLMAGEPAERMLGKTRGEMVGRGVAELFGSTALGEIIGRAFESGKLVEEQAVEIARPGRSPLRLVVGVRPLRNGTSPQDMGMLVTLRDIEGRRQLEQQLDFSSRLAAISRLTGGVAHEIKNPLNAMALHLEVLRGKLDGEQPEIEVIGREIKRLDSVVKTFLNFNRPVDLNYKPIDLNDLVKQVLALVSVDAAAKNVALKTVLQADELWINGDPDLLMQAILNVINNGMEAMSDGGKTEGGALTTRTSSEGGRCQLTVTDAGPGIPPEIQARVFQLYFTTKESGSGIGLATTFRVVQLHNGTIDFTSEPGKGTTFRLRFPRMVDYQDEVLTSVSTGF
jgi:PAS domain S-box-containing protein